MSVLQTTSLVLAGIGGGLTGSIAGLASLVTYPALLAVGLGPIAANATNTVSLVFSGVGSTLGSRPELVGQAARLRRLLPLAVGGGLVGAGLALVTGSGLFARIVPGLILAASVAIIVRRTPPGPATDRPGGVSPARADDPVRVDAPARPDAPVRANTPAGPDDPARVSASAGAESRSLPVWVAALGVYGGFFGAAAGVMLLAVLLAVTAEGLSRSNAAKNVLLGAANVSGAAVFIAFGPVRWSGAVPLAAGCLIGASLGPAVVRRVRPYPLRLTIGALGIGLAVVLGVRAY